jgi:pyruvate formate lyase activating enzyme
LAHAFSSFGTASDEFTDWASGWLIPGFNDSDDELRAIASFLRSVSPDIPWHVTAFHPNYRMAEPEDTSPATLTRAAAIGRQQGLRYVYAGNLPDAVGEFENSFCPDCRNTLIVRRGMETVDYRITRVGCCPDCGKAIPGSWKDPLCRPLAHRADVAWVHRYCG